MPFPSTLCGVLRASLGLDGTPALVRERCQALVAEVIACGGLHGRAVRLALAILTERDDP
jgi:hypothetical protein